MRLFIIYMILAFFALSFQATFFPHVKPDLVLILVCFYSIRKGQVKGMLYGALSGFLIDSASGFIIGPNILSKSIVGFFFSFIRQKFFLWNVFLNTLLIFLFSIVDILLVRAVLEIFSGVSFALRSSWIMVLSVLYTTSAGVAVYPIFMVKQAGVKGG